MEWKHLILALVLLAVLVTLAAVLVLDGPTSCQIPGLEASPWCK